MTRSELTELSRTSGVSVSTLYCIRRSAHNTLYGNVYAVAQALGLRLTLA